MPNSFEQIQLKPWPSGRSQEIAIIRELPDALATRLGISFSAGIDDLDVFDEAVLLLGSRRQLQLLHYRRHPFAGTQLVVDAGDDFVSARAEAMASLGLTPEDLTWELGGSSS